MPSAIGRAGTGALSLGNADSRLERQADQVAGYAQPSKQVAKDGTQLDRRLESKIRAPAGGGDLVPEVVRRKAEQATGAKLGGVRVFSGERSHMLNDQLHSDAFTHGNKIFLGKGQSKFDVQLMTHELVHTAQQSASGHGPATIQRKAQNLKIDKRLRQKYSGGRVNGWLAELRQLIEEYNAIPLDDTDYMRQLLLLRDISKKAFQIRGVVDSWGFLAKGKSLRSLGGPFRRAYMLLIRNLTMLAGNASDDHKNPPKWSIVPKEMRRVIDQGKQAQTAGREARRQELILDIDQFEQDELTLDPSELGLGNGNPQGWGMDDE